MGAVAGSGTQIPNGRVSVTMVFDLYESDHCFNDDLDGRVYGGYNWVRPGQPQSGTVYVPMQYESGDDSVTFAYLIEVTKVG
ncbi:hypothetical protein ABT369_21895 [Dactylosporangium sp. NPDC000244]|uniref:hypothetical protein n=1 Tax=Dactylosporangium sp. NPDC000244 TaxID=3154365 RepID=UPI00331D4DAB